MFVYFVESQQSQQLNEEQLLLTYLALGVVEGGLCAANTGGVVGCTILTRLQSLLLCLGPAVFVLLGASALVLVCCVWSCKYLWKKRKVIVSVMVLWDGT